MKKIDLELTLIENDDNTWELIIKPEGDINGMKSTWCKGENKDEVLDRIINILKNNNFYFNLMEKI
jgi:hypothetical protein